MQEYGLKIFYTGMGLLVLAVLLNVRSLAIYKGTRAYWTFGFGLFKYSLEFKPELKKPLKNHKFVNVVKIVIYYLGCVVCFLVNASIWVSIALIATGSLMVLI